MNVLGKKTKSCSTKGINANYLENTILDLVLDIINSSNLYKELDSASRERIKFLNGINGKNQIILELHPFISNLTGRRPIVLPVIMEVRESSKED